MTAKLEPAPKPRVLRIKVKPKARASTLTGPGADGFWHAALKAAPVDGRANAELVALVAERFGCRRSDVTLKAGAGARIKTVVVA